MMFLLLGISYSCTSNVMILARELVKQIEDDVKPKVRGEAKFVQANVNVMQLLKEFVDLSALRKIKQQVSTPM